MVNTTDAKIVPQFSIADCFTCLMCYLPLFGKVERMIEMNYNTKMFC